MTAAAIVLFTAAGVIWLIPLAVLAGCYVRDRIEDRAETQRRAEQKRVADAEWFGLLAVTSPSLSTSPAAERIRDQIAANEAGRIDAEWERWSK